MKENRRRGFPLKEWLDAELKDPEFKQHYDQASVKWRVAMEIVEARQKANLTQGELAEQIGDRQQNVSRIESGEQNVTVVTLEKIAKAVGGRLVVRIETGRPAKGATAGLLRERRRRRYGAAAKTARRAVSPP